MFEANSADVRRYFDFLGSIISGLIFGYITCEIVFEVFFTRSVEINELTLLPFIFILPSFVYWFFYKLVCETSKIKILAGYFNFILISIPSVSLLFLFYSIVLFKKLPEILDKEQFPKLLFMFVFINLIAILPMAFFWIIGILTASKFSKKNILP